MDIFSVLTLFGGLALFLYGMNVMGNGLEKAAGGRLERMLEKLTSSPLKGVLLGLAVTAVIQSSSATTVMVVGFVNAGIMKLSQAIGVIMGANIGTTVTAWILSLTGIQSDNVLVSLLKPDNFSPILAVIGIVLLLFCKRESKKDIGTILLGFAVLMFGMSAMSGAVKPLADVPEFREIMLAFSNPFLGVLVGALITGIIQSSSASVGILQALTQTGSVTYGVAIPLIMGQNIGTCVTALISCIGANKNAKRAAMVHLYFNIIGTILFLCLFYGLNAVFQFGFINDSMNPANIAVVHTTFNILSTAVLLPFSKQLGKLATLTVREKKSDGKTTILDQRFLNTPSFALEQCKRATVEMAELAEGIMTDAMDLIAQYDQKIADRISANEKKIDRYEDEIGSYLVQLSGRELSERDTREASMLLQSIGDFERIGDHAVNVLDAVLEMHQKKVHFSDHANEELSVMISALREILDLTIIAFKQEDLETAAKVEPLEQVIDGLRVELKKRHIVRLQKGHCTIELGFIYSDLFTDFERVSDHCSNIAVAVIQLQDAAFQSHDYLNEVKSSGQPEFVHDFRAYKDKYSLPV